MTSTKTKFHRDGTVTCWDVYQQQWVHRSASDLVAEAKRPSPNSILPTLPESERARIERMAENG